MDLDEPQCFSKQLTGVAKPLLKESARQGRLDPGVESLLAAAQFGSLERVRNLLHSGVDHSVRDHMDWTPLHYAARECHFEVCELLLDSGADAEALNAASMTALQVASQEDEEFALRFDALVNKRRNAN